MLNKLNIKNISVFLLSLTLSACASQIKQASNAHALSIDKWSELARYSESKLNNYPITLTAQLEHVLVDQQSNFQLTNFQLSKKENSYTINLLSPNFKHKYVCSPMCYQLLEYVEKGSKTHQTVRGSTLLNEFFIQHEFELFSFYGELFKMNTQINRLEDINAQQLSTYLDYISLEKKQFNTLNNFMLYLSSALSEEHYQTFLNDPHAAQLRQKTRRTHTIFLHALHPNESWQASKKQQTEQHLWSSNSQPERDQWLSKPNSPVRHLNNSSATPKTGSVSKAWLLAKNNDIELKAYVCSYKENKFGQVIDISKNRVTVQLMGQAKHLQDGILYDLEQGALFNNTASSVTFMPLNTPQTFSVLDLARCQPQ